MTEVPNVHVAIARVASDIGTIAKNQRVESGPAKFNFRGIDDVLDACHGPLAEHGVSVVPVDFDVIDNSERTTKSGALQVHLLAKVTFHILGPAGDHVVAAALAEALDTSDKAASKAMSMAYKYVAFQVFSIPVRGALEESDRETLERGSSARQDAQAAPQVTVEEIKARIEQATRDLSMDIESATGKFRSQQGDLTVDQMWSLPMETLYGFARQLVAYSQQQKARPTTTKEN